MNDNESIKRLTKLISALVNGRVDEVEAESESFASDWTDSEELKELQQEVLALARKHLQAEGFILNISKGNLDVEAPQGNRLLDPFKELQANLRHLVWQTREIAQGDYNQQIDFLGDFSNSFNSLIIALNEKKQTEKKLLESTARLKTLVQTIPDLIWLKDVDGVYLSCNNMFERFFGAPESEIVGKTDYDFVDCELADFFREHDLKAIQAGGPSSNEEWLTYADDGHRSLVEALKTPMFDSSGTLIGVLGIARDITERKKAEEAIIVSEARLKRAELASSSGNWELHFDSQTVYTSEGARMVYGLNMDPIDYLLIKSIPLPEYRPLLNEAMKNLIEDNHPYDIEFKIKTADTGEIKDIHSVAFYDKEKGVLFGTIQDVTDRKKTEDALKVNESSLRELNATKDKFFSIISHDLKSPFNSILGLSNLLVEQIQQKNVEGIEEYAGIIQNSSQRAMDLLMNLLEWSRSQTGRMEFSPEYIEMVALINEVIELLGDSAQQKSISIHRELPRNMLAFIDKAMISTVLRNLISNAIKFTRPGGRIVISAELKNAELIIAMRDNGVGIKKESIEKLFRIDENHSTLGTQNEKGSGLGLILCKEFIGKHGGKIWVESEVGKGSTFYFSIPKV